MTTFQAKTPLVVLIAFFGHHGNMFSAWTVAPWFS